MDTRKDIKLTLLKWQRKKETLSRVALEDLVRMIADGDQGDVVRHVRETYHLMQPRRADDGRVDNVFGPGLLPPRVCFAAAYEHRSGGLRLLRYNGLAVVEVNSLSGYDEAIALREAARSMPQTLLCFLGASGRSVKIVSRGELAPQGGLPTGEEAVATFHQQLYQKARKAYSAQLDISIESLPPRLDRTIYLSADPDLVWNPSAIPFYIDLHATDRTADAVRPSAQSTAAQNLLPGRTVQRTWQLNFLFILESVLGHYFDLPDEERQQQLVMQMAVRCMEEGIPMGIAQSMTLEHPVLNTDRLLVQKTFQAVYTVEHLRQYQEKNKFRPLKSIPEDTLLMMKTESFLQANYEMRKNVMTGVAQYRERSSESFDFRDLDQEVRNDMTIRAKELGLKSWDKDIDRFIDSTRIEKYDPVNDWLDRLPRWDGRDRIGPLASRVPTSQPHWPLYLRTWLLGMVAHWMGRSSLTGNALVPLLIGRQGCGKSSFCRILLPPALREYYNDRISFRNETDLSLDLTSFALINIDEFDKTTQRQQVLLKYLLSTADVKFRPPYGKAMKQYRRYASFIGTTNETKPLNDPTGSRRFVCVEVMGDIDFSDTLDHRQLYAQLRQLVNDGERYWLNDEETATLIEENERFQRVNAVEEMIAETFRKPDADDQQARWWTLGDIAARLQERYRSQDTRSLTLRAIGRALNIPRFHFSSRRRAQGVVYWLAERMAVIAALLLLAVPPLQAASIGERTKVSLTLADGLAGETVYSIFTSHNGDTWIATNSGVNCYNGRSMHAFVITGQGGRPLEVYDLCEAAGHLYAATAEGLYRMSYVGGPFERVPFDASVGSPLSSPEVGSIVSLLAVGDTVYMGSQQGLLYYDGHTLHHQDVSVSRKGLDNIVRQYVADAGGKIWFLGRFDLNSFDPRTGKTVRYALPEPLTHSVLTRFAIAADGLFVIGTRGDGLFTYHLPTGTLQQVDGVGKIVMSVQRSADGHICVGTDGAGAYLLEMRKEESGVRNGWRGDVVQHFSTDTSLQHNQLPTNGVYCYYRDANGVDWFGFVRHGLMHSYHSSNLFRLFSSGDFTTEGINVRTACHHGPHIVLGTQDGFYYVNSETGRSRYFSSDELSGGHIVNTVTWYDDCFYIGTFDGGLHVLDPATLVLSQQHIPSMLTTGSIGDVKAGPDGRLWIGSGSGLIIVSDGQVEQHFTEQNSHIVGGLILSITFDATGNAWLTGASGCSLYSARSREIVDTSFPKGFFHQQPWMRGAQGHDGLVFMRTGPQTFYTRSTFGRLQGKNEEMTDFGELRLPVQFKDKWCRSFIDDMQGHYLLASERGVFCFDYDASSPKGAVSGALHFGAGEGLRGDFINDLMLGDDGRLWVATSQGLYSADIQRFREWQQQSAYKVRLSAIRRGSDLMDMVEEYRANEEHSIRLSWNLTSEVLQAEAFLPDYAKQTGRIYEYRVGGGDWQLVDGQQPLRVSRLLLGSHPLEVRLAGAPGTSQVYTLTVLPSAWAVLEGLLLLIAATLLWLWWRYRKNTRVLLSERDEIEDALVEMMEEMEAPLGVVGGVSSSEAIGGPKYEKVKLDEVECAGIVSRMKEYVERERVYTNQELKMKDLADVLHLSAPKLSQVFNLYLGQNYYDFINGYRLQEFKRLIDEGAYKRYTITALSEQCGFKKSNFFSTFRKVEGMTPAEYLKKKGVKTVG